jgi:predicted MPP superfamily phosphohydrolase
VAEGWLSRIWRAQPHVIQRLDITIQHWPRTSRPLTIAFLSDLHVGSHSGDLNRLRGIVAEVRKSKPDVILHGGDFLPKALYGRKVPPVVVARLLGRLQAPLGQFAVLGNHDYQKRGEGLAAALIANGIEVLDDERRTIAFEDHKLDLIGIPDARRHREKAQALLNSLSPSPQRPAIILTHDPYWFAHVPAGPFLTLAGHTHGGQFRLPLIGPVVNMSRAPLRWTYGRVVERGSEMYVTSGLGTSGLPLRIGIPPEFVIMEVTGQEP